VEAKMYGKKPKQRSCKCVKRKHGQPKVTVGICHREDNGYRKAVRERINGKRLERDWSREVDPEDSDL
jgi:hypothetical protein